MATTRSHTAAERKPGQDGERNHRSADGDPWSHWSAALDSSTPAVEAGPNHKVERTVEAADPRLAHRRGSVLFSFSDSLLKKKLNLKLKNLNFMTMTFKDQLGTKTEQLETKVGELFTTYSPHYSSLEP